jgi:hypothetical protein
MTLCPLTCIIKTDGLASSLVRRFMVRSYKRGWFLFLGLVVMLLGLTIACGGGYASHKTTFYTYTNDKMGYAITCPDYWQVTVIDETKARLTLPPPFRGFISIQVVENPTVPFEAAVGTSVTLMEEKYTDFTLLDNKSLQGLWDWYLSYDFAGDYGVEFHGETYFKNTGMRFYKIDTVGEKTRYDDYAFGTIISTFKLLTD